MAACNLLLGTPSTTHIIIVLVIVLLLFGGSKLPELARGLGRGMRIFKEELHGVQKDLEQPPQQAGKSDDQSQPKA